ncbi:MAG: hypothetical protein V3W41_22605 [Planctomycetota bacterium]
MTVIKVETAKVYRAPTAGRRYLTKRAAIHNEATAMILKEWPIEDEGPDYNEWGRETYPGDYFDIRHNEPEAFQIMHDSLVSMIKNGFVTDDWKLDDNHEAWKAT